MNKARFEEKHGCLGDVIWRLKMTEIYFRIINNSLMECVTGNKQSFSSRWNKQRVPGKIILVCNSIEQYALFLRRNYAVVRLSYISIRNEN